MLLMIIFGGADKDELRARAGEGFYFPSTSHVPTAPG